MNALVDVNKLLSRDPSSNFDLFDDWIEYVQVSYSSMETSFL
jgi:hypothetical protein